MMLGVFVLDPLCLPRGQPGEHDDADRRHREMQRRALDEESVDQEPDEDADEAHQLGRQFAGLVGPPLAIEEPEHDRENDADQDIGLALAIGPR